MDIKDCKVGQRVSGDFYTGTITAVGVSLVLVMWDHESHDGAVQPRRLSLIEPKPWAPPEPLELVEVNLPFGGAPVWLTTFYDPGFGQATEGVTWRRTGRRVVTEEIP